MVVRRLAMLAHRAVTLDLLETFGKAHRKVNIRRLKIYDD